MEKFSASVGRAAVTAGGDLGGLGDYPSTSVLAGRKPTKIGAVAIDVAATFDY